MRVIKLEQEEVHLSHNLHNLKHRYELIRKLEKTNVEYRNSLLDQHSRLKTVSWFQKFLEESQNCPLCKSHNNESKESILKLIEVNDDIINRGARNKDTFLTVSQENMKLKGEIGQKEKRINEIRKEIISLRSSSQSVDRRLQNIFEISRFVGNLEAEIKNYENFNDNSDILDKIQELNTRIEQLESSINEKLMLQRLSSAKNQVDKKISHYSEIFKAENWNDRIIFDEDNLTISFISESGRESPLFEIGSGANYMAYHLSTILALHEFFSDMKNSPVPSFIFFDQPSQVYFPDKSEEEESEDMDRVKKIFMAMSESIIRTNNNVQIIAIEHVGEHAWDGLDNVYLNKRWRGSSDDSYLIPLNWI